jgi:hypothetical protein
MNGVPALLLVSNPHDGVTAMKTELDAMARCLPYDSPSENLIVGQESIAGLGVC